MCSPPLIMASLRGKDVYTTFTRRVAARDYPKGKSSKYSPLGCLWVWREGARMPFRGAEFKGIGTSGSTVSDAFQGLLPSGTLCVSRLPQVCWRNLCGLACFNPSAHPFVRGGSRRPLPEYNGWDSQEIGSLHGKEYIHSWERLHLLLVGIVFRCRGLLMASVILGIVSFVSCGPLPCLHISRYAKYVPVCSAMYSFSFCLSLRWMGWPWYRGHWAFEGCCSMSSALRYQCWTRRDALDVLGRARPFFLVGFTSRMGAAGNLNS